MLQFIGYGSAFNTKLGNNSAYIKNGNHLFLIDCGSNIFEKIMTMKLLDGIEKITVLITHTHPDHIGSLGDLVFYSYYSMGKIGETSLTILSPKDVNVNVVLKSMGVGLGLYNTKTLEDKANMIDIGNNIIIKPAKVNHVPELKCYGYELCFNSVLMYYSGDCNEIPERILKNLNAGLYDVFYQDTCIADYDGNVHLSLKNLNELVDESIFVRQKVYCMHLDNNFDYRVARAMGFKTIE